MQPLADGGEGTASVIAAARRGTWVEATATDPTGVHRPSEWLRLPDAAPPDPDAVVEMARASGWTLVQPRDRDPLSATSYGTGELIGAADRSGARHVWLTLGGSATVDGGTGAASALGWRFLDRAGRPVPPGGGGLLSLHRIEPPPHRLRARVTALYDVRNVLTGPRGAAAVFGPQKGAGPREVDVLERGLGRLADRIADDLGVDVRGLVGGGAAGGLGAGAVAFFEASLESGVERVLETTHFDRMLAGADWVMTGEGRLDATSFDGKVVGAVASRAASADVRLAIVAGEIGDDAMSVPAGRVSWMRGLSGPNVSPDEARRRAAELLRAAARDFAKEMLGADA